MLDHLQPIPTRNTRLSTLSRRGIRAVSVSGHAWTRSSRRETPRAVALLCTTWAAWRAAWEELRRYTARRRDVGLRGGGRTAARGHGLGSTSTKSAGPGAAGQGPAPVPPRHGPPRAGPSRGARSARGAGRVISEPGPDQRSAPHVSICHVGAGPPWCWPPVGCGLGPDPRHSAFSPASRARTRIFAGREHAQSVSRLRAAREALSLA